MWPDATEELTIELTAFARRDCTPDEKWVHFKRCVDLAFNCDGSTRRVIWNPWLKRAMMSILNGRRRDKIGWAGSASSGKSDAAALFAIISYWARPADTTVIVMSTTKSSARNRIWRSVLQFWGQAERMGCPGKLTDSIGVIKGMDADGRYNHNSGLKLEAAGRADVGEACDNLIGIKNAVVIVIADEMPDLGDGIIEAMDNLTVNERVLLIGLGNPNMRRDPFGILCEPLSGWKSVGEDDEEWKTIHGGTCVRFNAEKSPRIVDKEESYFWQPDQEWLDEHQAKGMKSRSYWRFVKAMWPPEGVTNGIFSEPEFINGGALDEREPQWEGRPTQLTALDPAFTRGGDDSEAGVAKVGKVNGKDHLHFCCSREMKENIQDSSDPLSHQMVKEWIRFATEDFDVRSSCAVMDGTGSGISFGHIVDKEWSPAVEKVNFGSKPSGRKPAFRSSKDGKDDQEYYDKNSELWIQVKPYLRSGQISGVTMEIMSQLVQRDYHDKSGRVLRVEDKKDAKKKNGGKSPDKADMFLLLVDKAIGNGLFKSEEVKVVSRKLNKEFAKVAKKRQVSNLTGRRLKTSGIGNRRLR